MALIVAGVAVVLAVVVVVAVVGRPAGPASGRFADLGGGVRMEFVRIPPGEFTMGCSEGDSECRDDEKPPHRVRITKAFELGKCEVTQAQWEAVMGSNPSHFKGPDRPVENVSWNAAQVFFQKLNARRGGHRYRLPTEAEWEYAARAGTTGIYAGALDAMAWHKENSGGETHPADRSRRTPGVCTTCTGTCGSGARTGMTATTTGRARERIQRGLQPGRPGRCGAVPGTSTRGTCGSRSASGSVLTTGDVVGLRCVRELVP